MFSLTVAKAYKFFKPHFCGCGAKWMAYIFRNHFHFIMIISEKNCFHILLFKILSFKECNGKGDAVTVYDGPGLPQGNSG